MKGSNFSNKYMVYGIKKDNEYLIYNKENESACSLRKQEFEILQLMVNAESFMDAFNMQNNYPIDDFMELQTKFIDAGLLNDNMESHKKKIKKTIHFYNWNKVFRCNKISYFILCMVLVLAIPLMFIGITKNIDNIQQLIEKNLNLGSNPPLICMIILVLSFLGGLFFHEVSHAIVATMMGACVPEIAISKKKILFYAYAKIIGMSHIKSVNKRIIIYLAGPLMNIFLLGMGLLLQSYFAELFYLSWSLIIPNFLLSIFNLSIFNYADGARILLELAFTPKYGKRFSDRE